jgi:hypothetical protein
MTTYIAHFRTDSSHATATIRAKSPAHALKKARRIAAEDESNLYFQAYDGAFPINEIAISDAEETAELALWCDADLRLRLAAPELLCAAQRVIARWEKSDLADAVRELSAAVHKAKGGES